MSHSAVNRPMDPKQRDQDIDQKLQLFGIFHGFKNGKMPSNKQIDIAMNSALQSKALSSPPAQLSDEGKVLVKDLRNVIEEAKKLMLSKNDGQLIQEFVWSCMHVEDDFKNNTNVRKPDFGGDKETAKNDAKTAGENLKTLGVLLVTNGEFRKLLNDVAVIARDMASDGTEEATKKLRPSEEQLAQVDKPAPDNVWHEKPDMEKLKSRAKSITKKSKDAAEESADDAKEASKEDAPEDAKSKTKEMAEKTKDYMNQKFPQERRDNALNRLKKMVMEIQGHPDYQRAIETLIAMVEKYAKQSKEVAEQGVGAAKDVRSNDTVRTMEYNLRTLIERFANSTSLDDVFGSLDNLYRDADEDPELRKWFSDINTYIKKILQQKGYIVSDDVDKDFNKLWDKGNYLLRDRYKGHTDRVLDEIKFFGEQFDQDEQNKAFGNAMDKLFKDLGNDRDGKPTFKKHLVKDLRDVVLPGIFENVRYIPIPRIEVSDPMVDVVVENIVIESDNLMPNVMEFGSDNYFRWGRKKISNKNDNKIMIAASGIQLDLRDIHYYIKKKEGFPSITDNGIMDVLLGGEGLSFKLTAANAQKEDKRHFFKLEDVKVDVHHMDIKLKKSKHKVLFGVFKPMLFSIVRPAIAKVAEQQIRDAFVKGDEFLYEAHLDAKKAGERAKNDPEDKTNGFNRFVDACKRKMEAKKQADAKKPKRDTKVEAPFSLHDSIFPNIVLPGAVSTKATEYVDKAKEGERWECPVFSIGNAKESTNIPRVPTITRKSHGPSASNGAKKAKADGTSAAKASKNGKDQSYSTRGFADEVTSAIDADGASKKAAANAPKIQSGTAFNPSRA